MVTQILVKSTLFEIFIFPYTPVAFQLIFCQFNNGAVLVAQKRDRATLF